MVPRVKPEDNEMSDDLTNTETSARFSDDRGVASVPGSLAAPLRKRDLEQANLLRLRWVTAARRLMPVDAFNFAQTAENNCSQFMAKRLEPELNET